MYERLILGSRPGFGSARDTLRVADNAARRRLVNWILPGALAALVIPILLLIGSLYHAWIWPMGGLAVRIILFDYAIFIYAWICGWNTAWRWRNNQSFIEELVVTNLRPGVVGNLLFAGSMSIWWRILLIVFLVDTAMFTLVYIDSLWLITDPDYITFIPIYIGMMLTVAAVSSLILAWFHLETIRIAYWMFAVAALPKVDLFMKAITNFFLIILYVSILTIIGSIVTVILGGFLLILLVAPSQRGFEPGMEFLVHGAWALAAIPGLLIVGLLKRIITSMYEESFTKTYLLFTWWGAAELDQPMTYPNELVRAYYRWKLFLKSEERENLRAQQQGKPEPETATPPADPVE